MLANGWYKGEAEARAAGGRAGEYPGRRKGHRKAGAAAAASAAKTNGNGKDGQGKQVLKRRRKKEGR